MQLGVPPPTRAAGCRVQLGTCKLLLPMGGMFLKFLVLGAWLGT